MADQDKTIGQLDIGAPLQGDEEVAATYSGTGTYRVSFFTIRNWFQNFFADRAAVEPHLQNTNIHFSDAPQDGIGYVRIDGTWRPERADAQRPFYIGHNYAIPGNITAGLSVPFFIPVRSNQETEIVEVIYGLTSAAGNTATFDIWLSGAPVAGLEDLVANETDQNSQPSSQTLISNRTRGRIDINSVVGNPVEFACCFVLQHTASNI